MAQFKLHSPTKPRKKDRDQKVVDGKEAKTSIWNREIELKPAFGAREKQRFFQLLGILLDSGLSITEGLEVIQGQQKKRLHKAIVAQITKALSEGQSLSEALRQQPKYFSTFEIFSIRMGEQSGQSVLVLQDLAAFHEKRLKLQRKLVQAFSYPAVVITIAFGVVYFMINFVVPMFRDIFARFDAELPDITNAVLYLSDLSTKYGGYVFLVMLGLFVLWTQLRKKRWYKSASSRLMLRIPLIGPIIGKVQVSRYCYSLALMLRSRVNLDQALELLEKVTTFEPLRATVAPVRKEVVEGKTLFQAMSSHAVFPSMLLQMVRVGEKTARLDDMLEQVAINLEDESETGISTLTSLLEPLLIVILGLVVGLILVSMYLPMFELSNTIGS